MWFNQQNDWLKIPDFQFQSGETLDELTLHYWRLGEIQRGSDGRVNNAILILHGTGGAGDSFLRPQFADSLFGPGCPLDAQKYFIILPDGIGHGRSSKPSDGLRGRFPNYRYRDMVEAQKRLVSEHLGVDHLRLVMGTSMGGMHSWMWGYLWPEMMDGLLPLASAPVQIAGRNRMIRRMIIDSIRHSPDWAGGEYDEQPRGLIQAVHALLFMVSSPWHWRQEAPTLAEADRLFERLVGEYAGRFDANDMLSMFAASEDYDPEPHLERIIAPLLAINSADDQVNPPELGILERTIGRVRQGQYVLLPHSPQTRGHGTHSLPAVWQSHLIDFLDRIDSDQ